jgi:hypothetical protein
MRNWDSLRPVRLFHLPNKVKDIVDTRTRSLVLHRDGS